MWKWGKLFTKFCAPFLSLSRKISPIFRLNVQKSVLGFSSIKAGTWTSLLSWACNENQLKGISWRGGLGEETSNSAGVLDQLWFKYWIFLFYHSPLFQETQRQLIFGKVLRPTHPQSGFPNSCSIIYIQFSVSKRPGSTMNLFIYFYLFIIFMYRYIVTLI